MLRTNSKQARANLRAYIMESWNTEPEEQGRTWEETKADILESFAIQAYSSEAERMQSRAGAFRGWLQGLPHGLGDFHLCRAVDDLGGILEENEAERNRYSEDQAAEKLGALIFDEVTR